MRIFPTLIVKMINFFFFFFFGLVKKLVKHSKINLLIYPYAKNKKVIVYFIHLKSLLFNRKMRLHFLANRYAFHCAECGSDLPFEAMVVGLQWLMCWARISRFALGS